MKADSIETYGSGYRYSWNGSHGIVIEIDRLRDTRGKVDAEISVHSLIGRVYHSSINLLYAKARKEAANSCKARKFDINWLDVPWDDVIDEVCLHALEAHRKGIPAVKVGNNTIDRPKFLMFPFLVKGQPNLIYGPGESGKSMLTTFIALLLQSGQGRCKLDPIEQANTLYLDYETDDIEINYRASFLKRGMGLPEDLEFLYRSSSQPLAHEVDDIQRIISDNDIKFVIVDSFTKACGGDSTQAEPVTNYYRALRAFGLTTLTIDHVAKAGGSPLYGSVFKYNEARNIFTIKSAKEDDQDSVEIAVVHTKFNNGGRVQPFGYKYSFYDDGTIVEPVNVTENATLSSGLPMQYQIAGLLKRGGLSVKDIAAELGADPDTVRRTLNRYKDSKFTALMDNHWGLKAHGA